MTGAKMCGALESWGGLARTNAARCAIGVGCRAPRTAREVQRAGEERSDMNIYTNSYLPIGLLGLLWAVAYLSYWWFLS